MAQPRNKRIPPFSLRLTPEERVRLEKDAAGMPLGSYIRSCLLSEGKSRKPPVKDYTALGKVLAELGRLELGKHLGELAQAVRVGALEVSPDTEKALREACRDVRRLRNALVSALGLQPVEDEDDP